MRITAGKWRSQKVSTPRGEQTRPTSSRVREAIFNICQEEVQGAQVLDLYAGSGIMSLEALSRGASSATLIDNNINAKRVILKNREQFCAEQEMRFLFGDVFSRLKQLEEKGARFTIIFADPPYGKGHGEKLLMFLENSSLLAKNGLLFIEEGVEIEMKLDTLSFKECRSYGGTKLHRWRGQ